MRTAAQWDASARALEADVDRVRAALDERAPGDVVAAWPYHGVSLRLRGGRYVLLSCRESTASFFDKLAAGADALAALDEASRGV